jgi:hypothetical protein
VEREPWSCVARAAIGRAPGLERGDTLAAEDLVRLGELLVQKGVISVEQLQTSLHEQSRFGGRLGTSLIQLGYVDVDTIALALSDQQELPPALREHVASIDRKTLTLFPPRIVTTHKVVPIGYTVGKPARLVVASMTPRALPIEDLAFAAGRRIEPWVAPEMLIQECLERYFGAPPMSARYVSMKLPARNPPAALAPQRAPAGLQVAPPRGSLAQMDAPPTRAFPPSPSSHKGAALSPPPAPTRTLEMPEVPAALPAPIALAPEAPPPEEEPPHDDAPGEWDIPEVPDDAPVELRPLTAPPEALRPVIDHAEASRMLEMATSKEQIGRVLEDWLRSTFGCGLVLVVKGDMAIGWRGFFPDAEDLIEAVAIPLGKPSMFSTAFESQKPFRGAPPAEGAKLQERMWKLLRCAPPAEVLVYPVMLGKRAVNLIYAHMEDGSSLADDVVDDARELCADVAAAYAKVIGKGKR